MDKNRAQSYYAAPLGESEAPRKTIELLSVAWQEQIQTLEREENKVKSGDAEALHRFRISLRKTRELLKLFSPFLSDTKK